MSIKPEKLQCGLALIIVNCDAYDAMCKAHGKNRSHDLPFDVVYKEWVTHCLLTVTRAKHIISAISAHNFNNVTRQIKGGYSVYGGVLTVTINDVAYSDADYTAVVTKLRHLGLRIEYV